MPPMRALGAARFPKDISWLTFACLRSSLGKPTRSPTFLPTRSWRDGWILAAHAAQVMEDVGLPTVASVRSELAQSAPDRPETLIAGALLMAAGRGWKRRSVDQTAANDSLPALRRGSCGFPFVSGFSALGVVTLDSVCPPKRLASILCSSQRLRPRRAGSSRFYEREFTRSSATSRTPLRWRTQGARKDGSCYL